MIVQTHHLTVHRTARYLTLGDCNTVDEIWFVLHGYSQLARHFIRWFEPAVRPGRLIVAPEALSRSYFEAKDGIRRVGASWMTKEDRETEIRDYVHYLDRLADEVRSGLPAGARVQVHGFSQGAAAAARWAASGHQAIERLVVWGSTLPPDLDLEHLRSSLRGMPVVLVLGDRDFYVSAEQMQAELTRLSEQKLPSQFVPFVGGHTVDRDTLLRLAADPASA